MKKLLLASLLLLAGAGCTVTGRVYCEHARGPDKAGASMEWKSE